MSTWVGVARAWESPRRALCSQGDSRVFEAEERSRCSADWWGPALHPVAPRCRAGWVLALSLAERSAGCHNQGAGLTLWDLLPGAGLRSVSSAPTLHTDGPSASARCWAGFPLLLPGSAGRWGLGQGLSSPLPFPRSPRHHPGPAGGSAQGALDGAGARLSPKRRAQVSHTHPRAPCLRSPQPALTGLLSQRWTRRTTSGAAASASVR